ncbi:MAG: cysteine--tRNA ligase [Candidatus Magasanikbacteria bacterium]
MLNLYNTLTRKKEDFTPLKKGLLKSKEVGLYTCGPTVYNFAHIGNLRSYVFEDILKRVLEYNNYKVKHVMNITDVGHLTDDADAGEDKMEKGAKREGKTAWEIAEFYTEAFKSNLHDLNIEEPNIWCKATDHIQKQIDLVQKLIDKGVTYETSDGIYFDTTKIDDYGKMANLRNQELKAGERVDMGEKKNATDFALWKWSSRHSELHPEGTAVPEGSQRQMEWQAFEHMGFPGWHIECSAMSMKYLGEQFDIHCGGIDHIPVHHTNEIAQSETLTGKKPWVKYWLHNEFLNMGTEKMAKSAGNFITLQTLKEKNISPIAYRYFLLQTHYRKQLNFSWEALEAAQTGLNRLYKEVNKIKDKEINGDKEINATFLERINDDLDTPGALALVWESLKQDKLDYPTLLEFDKILGLDISTQGGSASGGETIIPDEVQKLLDERQIAREAKDYKKSDELRDEIKKLGWEVKDTSVGQEMTKL